MDGTETFPKRFGAELRPLIRINFEVADRDRDTGTEAVEAGTFASGKLEDLHELRFFARGGDELQNAGSVDEQKPALSWDSLLLTVNLIFSCFVSRLDGQVFEGEPTGDNVVGDILDRSFVSESVGLQPRIGDGCGGVHLHKNHPGSLMHFPAQRR